MITSIILLTFNKLDYTKQCIESIRTYTKQGTYEIIVVDNASTDGTVEWLQQQNDLIVILNENNEGFPKGCNQGIAAAQGDFIMLLNNDTLVTHKWLENLKHCLCSDDHIGAVGPVTNHASYYTAIKVPYRTVEEMQQFAQQYNVSDPTKWEERLKLIGFCLLIKREAIERIGLLDERFGMGNFEDDDYGARLRKAGYKLMLCRDTFIHHYGSISFGSDTVRFREVLQENEQKCIEKWGFSPISQTMIRYDLLSIINEKGNDAKEPFRVLDIGCGCGGTLLQIKNKFPNAELYGIELNMHAGSIASNIATIEGHSDTPPQWTYPQQFFNCILIENGIFSESSSDYLRMLCPFLKEEGILIASYQNPEDFSLEQIKQVFKEAGFAGAELYTMNEADKKPHGTQYFMVKVLKREFGDQELSIICSELASGIDKEKNLERVAVLLSGSQTAHDHIIRTPMPDPHTKAKILAEIAEFLYYRQINDPILPMLKAAYALNPKDPEISFNLGFLLMKANQYDAALPYFEAIEDKDEDVVSLIRKINELELSRKRTMNPSEICFIYCVNQEDLLQESLHFISALKIPDGMEVEVQKIYNARSMTSGYNEAMMKSDAKYKVYLHQDVHIINPSFIVDMLEIFQANSKLGMLGVVGASYLPLNGLWWESAEKHGQVYESHTGQMGLLSFGSCSNGHRYQPVAAIDGLIMMTQVDLRWRDDLIPGWHFYDLSQCCEFIRAGFEVGIPLQETPWTVHDCGIVNVSNGFAENRERFINEYWNDLRLRFNSYVTGRVNGNSSPDSSFGELDQLKFETHLLEYERLI